jgi:hypothetical protein
MVRLTYLLILFAATAAPAQDERPPANEIRVFKLQYVRSSETGPTLSQLFDDVVITGDERTNSLIVRGTPEELEEIGALLKKLDESANVPGTRYVPGLRYQQAVRGYAAALPRPTKQSPLQKEYQRLEGEITKTADMCRQLENDPTAVSDKRRDDLVEQLSQLITKAFDVRQEMRREDVQRLRDRLKQVETTVNKREEAKDEIIEHRVASLLDADQEVAPRTPIAGPDFPQPLARSPYTPGSLYTAPVSPNSPPAKSGPIGLPGPPHSIPSLPPLNSQALRPTGNAANPLGSSDHLDLVRTAEMCREAAKGSDLLRIESRVAAFRAVERRFKTYVELATLELQAAESKLDGSKRQFERTKSLFESGVTTSTEYDKARDEFKAVEFDVQRARITRDFYEQTLVEAQAIVEKALDTVKKRAKESDAEGSTGTVR